MKDKLRKVKKPAKLLKSKKKFLSEPKKELKMQTMSVDDFMSGFMNEESSDSNISSLNKSKLKKGKNKASSKRYELSSVEDEEEKDDDDDGNDDVDDDDDDDDDDDVDDVDDDDDGNDDGNDDVNDDVDDDDDDDVDDDDEFQSHKKHLDDLKKSDPEFYKYLEENDQELLKFDDSDSDNEDDEKNEKFHQVPDSLEVASDESDFEVDEDFAKKKTGASNRVTATMVTHWQAGLAKGNISALRKAADAFHAALVSVSTEKDTTSAYIVEGGVIFNCVIRMCIVDFLPGIQKALKIPVSYKVHPKNSRNWSKVKPILRAYLTDLSELSRVTSPEMLTVLLKHIHQLSPFIACFPALAPKFLKRVVQLWAMDEDIIRVLAFLCALRLGNLRPSLLKQGLKIMHLTYVRNTKFMSPSTLPGVNFMRQSLCEMFALDNTISYHMAFIYIRQLAIHLRNAVTLKKKDSYKTVYNWAFVSCLHLWAELFGMVSYASPLRSLTYPLIQLIIGTIKLIPSAQFFPLRFHCIRILIKVSGKCGIFIPILPFLLEVLRDFNFNREHKKLSMKPMDLTCLLRCSKSQMKENSFKDALIDNVHDLLIEYLATECHRLSFPDIMVPCVLELKQFLKTCKVANYNKKMKAILDKITENSKFIEAERKKLTVKLNDLNGVEAAETVMRSKNPPFLKYYESWREIHLQQQARKVTNNQKLGDFKLPVLYKLEKKRSRVDTKPVGPPELFPSDEENSDSEMLKESEDEEVEQEEEEKEIPAKKRKKQKKEWKTERKRQEDKQEEDFADDVEDIIQDLKYSDLV